MTLRIANVVLDCDDTLAVARFWSAVLDRPIDDGASEHFASIRTADQPGPGPLNMFFAKVPEDTLSEVRSQAWQRGTPL